MAEEKKDDTTEVQPAEVTEDDLRNLVGEVVEEKLQGLSEGIGGLAESIVEKLKGDGSSEDSLVEKITGIIDDRLKGLGGSSKETGGNGATESGERIPKLRIFK